MKFNRLALIERAKVAIGEAEKAAEARTADDLAKAHTSAADYLARHGDDWSQFAAAIRAAGRAKRPVVISDVPESLREQRYGGPAVQLFAPHKPKTHTAYTGELLHLIAVLEAVTDDEVSSSGLAAIGITRIP